MKMAISFLFAMSVLLPDTATAGSSAVSKEGSELDVTWSRNGVPKLLARGGHYFVHGIRYPSGPLEGGGILVTHVDRISGAMKVLYVSGTEIIPTVAQRFLRVQIAGVARDSDRLYVLERATSTQANPFALKLHVQPLVEIAATYRIQLFRLSDGAVANRQNVGVRQEWLAPAETLEPGPLRVVADGIEVFGRKVKMPTLDIKRNTNEVPKLLALDQNYFVHGIRYPSDRVARPKGDGGALITHMDRRSGAMKTLCASWAGPVKTSKNAFVQVRIAGVARDLTRLYVLEWTVVTHERPSEVVGTPNPHAFRMPGAYRLRYYRLSDGKVAGSREVKGPKNWEVPPETLDGGLLRVLDDGVEVRGRILTIQK